MRQHNGWSELFRLLEFVEDPRKPRGVRHKLSEALLVIIGALLAGARNAEEVAYWGRERVDWLTQFGEFKHGTPSHDTVLELCAILRPETIETLVSSWVEYFLRSQEMEMAGSQVAIDGKTQRGSRSSDGSSVQLVSAWLVEAGVVLRSESIEKKSNEIKAIPCLIEALDLRGATVTIDAMGCQRAIVRDICAAGADYVVQVKGNQPGLQEECRAVALEVSKPGRGLLDADRVELHRDITKGHGRVETRVCHLVRGLSLLTRREMWAGYRVARREDLAPVEAPAQP